MLFCSLIFWRSCHWDKFCIFSVSLNLSEKNNFEHAKNVDFFSLWHAKHASSVLVSPSSNPFIFKYFTIKCQMQSNSIRIVVEPWNDTVLVALIFNQFILYWIHGQGLECAMFESDCLSWRQESSSILFTSTASNPSHVSDRLLVHTWNIWNRW